MRRVALVWIALLFASVVSAHEVRPARLEITQLDAHTYQTVWKLPTRGDVAIHLVPHLSNGWLDREPHDQYATDGFLIRTWITRAPDSESLAGATLAIEGLADTITDVLVSVEVLGVDPIHAILRPEQPEWRVSLAGADQKTAWALLTLGVRHILTGPDHLLFVFGLLLIVRDRWMLLKAISAFTVAHSITLATAMLAKVSLAAPLVESLIALSILVLGVEVVRAQRGDTSLTIRYPWAVAFVFGLFHGMGFAGGLASLGYAKQDLAAALVFFNLGVEVGQLGFIGLVLLLARGLASLAAKQPELAIRVPAYVVGISGAFWTFQTSAAWMGIG